MEVYTLNMSSSETNSRIGPNRNNSRKGVQNENRSRKGQKQSDNDFNDLTSAKTI